MTFYNDIITCFLFWCLLIIFPLSISYSYANVIFSNKYSGLIIGISSIGWGQTTTILYDIANVPNRNYIGNYIVNHVTNIEGMIMIFAYLYVSWNYNILPDTYYSTKGSLNILDISKQLLVQDFFQYCIHILEHRVEYIYKITHKQHHIHIYPVLYNSFNGSISDTFFMIICPLYLTSQVVHVNLWNYITFGTIYSSWLLLIHTEYDHPWDRVFKYIGLGTPEFHRIHHKYFKYNYGHTFTYWDILFNTIYNNKSESNPLLFSKLNQR